MRPTSGRESVHSMATGTSAFSAAAHSQSSVPSASQRARGIVQERPSQAKHARLTTPRDQSCARLVRLIERQRSHDGEAARPGAHRFEGHLGRLGVPTGRVDDGGIDAGFIHQGNGFAGRERGNLPVGCVTRQASAPSVDLSVDNLHELPPGCWRHPRGTVQQAVIALAGRSSAPRSRLRSHSSR